MAITRPRRAGLPRVAGGTGDVVTFYAARQHWHATRWRGTPVVVFDDERAVLTAMWEARQHGLLGQVPALLRLDAHHDQWPLTASEEAAWRQALRRGDRRGMWLFVEFGMRGDDANWVWAAAVGRMVTHVVTFYVTEQPHARRLPEVPSLLLRGLGAELEPGGRLAPTGGGQPAIPGWDDRQCRFGADGQPYVLSIDLDAFTTSSGPDDMPQAWPTQRLRDEPLSPRQTGHGNVCAADVLRAAAERAALVTIAREPWYCGGDGNAARLLSVLDETVFDGGLSAS